MLKLNHYLAIILALVLFTGLAFGADDMLILDSALYQEAENKDTQNKEAPTAAIDTDKKNSMTWPMLPGESLNDVARLFYPKNKAMQQQFVAKTLTLSANIVPNLKPSQRFTAPNLLIIPTLKSLSKSAANVGKKPNNKSLKMSYGLKQAIEQIPGKLKQEYETLVVKNEFLKEKLAKLNENIVFLETKLVELKLIFDKTLTLPQPSSVAGETADTSQAAVLAPAPTSETTPNDTALSTQGGKKVFKNLNETDTKKVDVKKPAVATIEPPAEPSIIDSLNTDLVKVALLMASLLLLGAFLLKKYRERMFAKLSFAATKIQHTVTDFSGYFEKTKHNKDENSAALQQDQAAKAVESLLHSSLEEAKLLMSVNRTTDAIEHLKMTIQSQPKASINHWLYLLEVYRKLNLKADFEETAKNLHEIFNVMTPVWYQKDESPMAALIVPQSLEEFPHIVEQLQGVWPGELAGVYLRNLITDNRGGERTGFGKEVVSEILMLIALLDTLKALPND